VSPSPSEERIIELGKERYWSSVNKLKQAGRVSATPAGNYILREATAQLSTGLEDWLVNAESKPGRRHTSCALFRKLSTDVAAFIITRACLDAVALRRSFMSIAQHIGALLEDEYRFTEIKKQDRTAWGGVLRSMRGRSYTRKKDKLRALVGQREIEIEAWTMKEKAHLGVISIELLRKHTGIVDIENINLGCKTQTHVSPTPAFLDWLRNAEKRNEGCRPLLMPLSQPPLPWSNLYSGGYRHEKLSGKALVKTRSNEQLRLLESADLSRVFRAVNALQETSYQINTKVYSVFEELHLRGMDIAGLPRLEPHPDPPQPADIGTNKEARDAWRKDKYRVKMLNVELVAKRLAVANLKMTASECLGSAFYYPYFCDFRGRMYARGFFLNPMAGDLSRGMLQFGEAKPITTEEQADYLRVQGANCYGQGINLNSLQERVRWVRENAERIQSVAADPLADLWWSTASDPWQFLSFCIDYAAFIKEGLGYSSRLCVAMDGRNNGLQNYAMLLRDEQLAAATGCRPTADPPDIYTRVGLIVTKKLRELIGLDKGAEQVLELFNGEIPRSICKGPVMVIPYGSTIKSIQDHLIQWYYDEGRHMNISGVSTQGFRECGLLASLIWKAIQQEDIAASALRGMDYFRQVARTMANESEHLTWQTPSGFVGMQSYVNQSTTVIKTTLGDGVRKHRLNVPTDDIDRKRSVSAFPANFIHSLDASSLVGTINLSLDQAEGEPMSYWCIHDSYGTHAACAPDLARQLRAAHIQTFDSDPLTVFHHDTSKRLRSLSSPATLPDPPTAGPWVPQELERSTYFFS